MILIDFGNTRFKWQIRGPGASIEAQGGGEHERGRKLAPLAAALEGAVRKPEPVWIASVVGVPLETELTAALARWQPRPDRIVWIRAETTRAGVHAGYEDPQRLGADRWAALIGAWQRHRQACLILSLGTAVTLDVLDERGFHRGGLIAPGRRVLAQALAGATAQLPEVRLPGERSLGRNTEAALANGCQFMLEGFVECAAPRLSRMLTTDPVRIITGGDALILDPALLARWRHEPDLVFDGLAYLAEVT